MGGGTFWHRRWIFPHCVSDRAAQYIAADIAAAGADVEKTDVEWDFDYDTGAKKFTADNIYVDVHQGDYFAGVSYARLNAPGRSYVEGVAVQRGGLQPDADYGGLWKADQGGFERGGER